MSWTLEGGYSNRCRLCGRWWNDADGGCDCPGPDEEDEGESEEDE